VLSKRPCSKLLSPGIQIALSQQGLGNCLCEEVAKKECGCYEGDRNCDCEGEARRRVQMYKLLRQLLKVSVELIDVGRVVARFDASYYAFGVVITTEDNDGRTARDLAEGSDRVIKALNGEEPDFYIYKDHMILL